MKNCCLLYVTRWLTECGNFVVAVVVVVIFYYFIQNETKYLLSSRIVHDKMCLYSCVCVLCSFECVCVCVCELWSVYYYYIIICARCACEFVNIIENWKWPFLVSSYFVMPFFLILHAHFRIEHYSFMASALEGTNWQTNTKKKNKKKMRWL